MRVELTTEALHDAAWQTALVTQAVRFMDFEAISELADIYELQGTTTGSGDGFVWTVSAAPAPEEVPTLNSVAVALLALALAGMGLGVLRSRSHL